MSHEIELSGQSLTVEVAHDQQKRYTGLSEKDDLGPDEGMLFVWPTEKEHRLVMRDMNFGVDMVFADASGNVTKVHSTGPDGEGTTAFSKFAVELPRGWTKKAGVEKEDTLDVNESGFEKSDTPTDSLDTLKEEVAAEFFQRADMDVGMFAALASETPDPTQEEVDAPYNEVEGETPDGSTTEKQDDFDLEGVTFYSEINDENVKIEGVEGDKVRVSQGEHEWWERMEDVRDKITDGAWDEKDDPCWDGYEQVGMKEGENGEQVPNCVPKSKAKEVRATRKSLNRLFKVRNFVNTPFASDAEVEGNRLSLTPPFSKDEAEYRAPGDSEYDESHEECQSCAFYVQGGGCLMVQGEIGSDAYCENMYSDVAVSGHAHTDEEVAEEVTIWGDEYEWDESLIEEFTEGVREILTEGEGLGKARSLMKEWIPYVGPQGGEGWQDAGSGEVRYQQDAPGEVAEGYEEDYWDDNSAEGEEGRAEPGSDSSGLPDSGTEQREEGYFVSAEPNPEEDVPAFQENEEASQLIETTNSEPMEGFSVHRNLDTYDATQDDAWIVGMTSVELPAEEGISKDDVTGFYDEYLDVLEQTPALRIGGYHFENGEKISIDLSVALTDRDEAEELGRELNQESIFNPAVALGEGDWDNGSVMTDGDGASPLETPEDVLETISNVETLAKSIINALRVEVNRTMTKQEEGLDPEAEFRNEAGRTLSRMQIFRFGWKEGAEIESVEEGYMVNGELYRSVNNGDE